MKILHDSRLQDGWITIIIEGRYISAKVYDEPSQFGYRRGRISKISISKTDEPPRNWDQLDFNYDRGLDFNEFSKLRSK